MDGGRGEVLEIVEEEQSSRAVQRLGNRFDEASFRRFAHTYRSGDGVRDEMPVRDRRQPHEMDGPLQRGRRGDLESKTAFPPP